MYRYKRAKPNKLKNLVKMVLLVILSSILSISLYKIYEGIEIDTYGIEEKASNIQIEKTVQTIAQEKEENKQTTDIIEEVTSCVVGISKIKKTGSTIFLQEGTTSLGLGTGVIIDSNGYILSNEHVTGEKYSNCYVTLENGKTYSANVLWSDSSLDLSISKINVRGLPYAKLGDSDNIRVGEKVYAIGNPIGYEFRRTVTSGIISALNRSIKIEEENKTTYMEDLIQTDATINPGNSGGPLINVEGNMIGITSVKITSAEGIGFAVPINVIKPILEKFQKEGKFEEALLGIFAYDKEVIPYLKSTNTGINTNTNAETNFEKGIYVEQISIDSPITKAKADLKEGDIILKIDNLELNKMCDLRCYIYTKSPGDEVELTINRSGKEKQIKVILGKK